MLGLDKQGGIYGTKVGLILFRHEWRVSAGGRPPRRWRRSLEGVRTPVLREGGFEGG